MFICLEGPDGCGKSSHALKLQKRLNASLMKFPNKDSISGKFIYDNLEGKWAPRSFLLTQPLSAPEEKLNPLVFQALQSLNRLELAPEILRQARLGNLVMDRYWPSAYAYGKADGLEGEYLIRIHETLPQPDLFILLDIDIADSFERRPERRDRYEMNQPFMKKVMENYRELWTAHARVVPATFKIVNARGTSEQTAKLIEDCVAEYKEKYELA